MSIEPVELRGGVGRLRWGMRKNREPELKEAGTCAYKQNAAGTLGTP